MAKKPRTNRQRDKDKRKRLRFSPAQMVQPGSGDLGVPAHPSNVRGNEVASSSQMPDLREEYRYVIVDLKRIGVIAVAMLGLLIALALLLT